MGLPLLEGVLSASLGGEGLGELLFVEAAAAPGDGGVVHLVRDAEVAEGAEQALLDAGGDVAAVDEVLLTQAEEVAAVGALGGGGEAEEEAGVEVVEDAAVGGGRGVVELVHDEVVEVIPRELPQVLLAAEGLDGGEEDVGVLVFGRSRVLAEAGLGPDAAEGAEGLVEDLVAVGDEEDALVLEAVEGAEPGLAVGRWRGV